MSDPLLTMDASELEAWPPGTLAHYLLWYCAKKEFYEQQIDAAFAHASSGDARAARVELSKARWS